MTRLLSLTALTFTCAAAPAGPGFRPPAVPLVAHDPYFSVWSPADKLTDATTTHWTGKPHPLRGMVRIDGTAYRVLGADPADVPALPQTGVRVLPTRTIYTFANDQVSLTLTFLTPALPSDLDLLSRPLTYLVWEAKSADGRPHEVAAYFEASPLLAVNTPDQKVTWTRPAVPGLDAARVGTRDQRVLAKQGDDLRIDWGWLYLAADPKHGEAVAADGPAARAAFREKKRVVGTPDWDDPAEKAPALVGTLDFGAVGTTPVERRLMLAYDDEWAVRYFEEDLRPYWRRAGQDAAGMLTAAAKDYPTVAERCRKFDDELLADLRQFGDGYADLAALSYRQTLAGCKLAADRAGRPLLFPKENHSNGCLATVDVIYPMAPFTLLLSPALTKAMLVPVLDYAGSKRWKFAYAPHDLGRYPHATGQVYGGGERTDDRQMMVEESANMILLVAALAEAEGKTDFAERYWPLLAKWAAYLREKGLDPENQLCTDDFAGHLAHNVNLSAKAIVALGAYAKLCGKRGLNDEAATYAGIARGFADKWVKLADDGDHFRLAFDKPGTWSQKYNLVWDRLLGLNLFPAAAVKTDVEFYKRTQLAHGLPLDNRSAYTKLDWTVWTASLTGSRADFDALVKPVVKWVSATPDRSPLTDWYFTDSAKKRGFTARPVVGGVFIPLLGDKPLWRKWAAAGEAVAGPWAPIPVRNWTEIAPTGVDKPADWQVRYQKPAGNNWTTADFKPGNGWQTQPAPFGLTAEVGTETRTQWAGGDIWLRREFELSAVSADPRVRATYSGPTEVYVNGVLAAKLEGTLRGYENVRLTPEARAALKPGKNVLAVRSAAPKPKGMQARLHLDVGLIDLAPADAPTPAARAKRPNVVVVLVDDMGWSDLGCYGSEIPTPNLDALAANGVRFTQFYNTARCCPTRASLLTGLYPHQAGVGHMVEDAGEKYPGYRGRLNDRCVTLAEVARSAGYFTAMTGKWHVGQNHGTTPWGRGFDRSLNAAAGGFYFPDSPRADLFLNGTSVGRRGHGVPDQWYSTDLWTEFGLKFVDEARSAKKPFLLYLAHNAPHFPLQAPPEDVARFRGSYKAGWDKLREARHAKQKAMGLIDPTWPSAPRPDGVKAWDALTDAEKDRFDHVMAIYAACVARMDKAVGDLVAGLRQRGELDNTLILFMSDNGGNAESGPNGRLEGKVPGDAASTVYCGESWAWLQNTPFRRYKHFTHEGGISSPLIAHWPAGIAAKGELRTQPGHLIDVMATVVDVSGAAYPAEVAGKPIRPMEGKSLVPAFAGRPVERDAIYWEHEGNAAVRAGDWKLVRFHANGPWELYDLKADRTEQRNLAEANPDKAKELAAKWAAWAARADVEPRPPAAKKKAKN